MLTTSQPPPKNNTRPRRSAWKQFVFDCGSPIAISRLLFITTLVALVIHLVLSKMPVFDFVNTINFTSLWVIVGVVIYLLDIVLRWMCITKDFFLQNPLKDWKGYPKTRSESYNWLFALLLIILLLLWWSPPWLSGSIEHLSSWMSSHSVFSNTGSGVLSSLPMEENSTDNVEALSGAREETDGGKPLILNDNHDPKCALIGYATDVCKLDPKYASYLEAAKASKIDDVIYKETLNTGRKCWDCGNVITGINRYPSDCNPFIVTMNGRHPLTKVSQISSSCF